MKIYGFARGGLDFEDDSAPKRERSSIAFLPALSVVPMIQHAGNAARPVVAVGDYVEEGMVIGRAESKGAANVHAPVPGRILRSVLWRMSDGRTSEALVIRLGGGFTKLGKKRELFSWNGLAPTDLQRLIAERGVTQLEEPGRPVAELVASVRASERKSSIVATVIFDDPWLVADWAVSQERTDEVAEGLAIVSKASGSTVSAVAVSFRDRELGARIVSSIERFGITAHLVTVRDRYPQRNARELEFSLRSFERKNGMEFGELVKFSPSTLAAVYDAVRFNVPLLERYVAVGGAAVKRPAVLRLRIGTRIGDAIAECGGFVEEPRRIVVGSPLTGSAVADLDVPVTKTTFAIAVLTARQIRGSIARECINCGACRRVCPVDLDPERLYKLALLGLYEDARNDGALSCHGCACCAAVCPSRLPLRAMIVHCQGRGRTG